MKGGRGDSPRRTRPLPALQARHHLRGLTRLVLFEALRETLTVRLDGTGMTTPTKEQLDELERLGARLVFQGLRRDEMVRLSAALPGLIQAARFITEHGDELQDALSTFDGEPWGEPRRLMHDALSALLERFGKR